MNITKNLFLSLGLLLCMSTRAADNEKITDIDTYNQIKLAVFAKRAGTNFEEKFNNNHPHPTKGALFELAGHIDVYNPDYNGKPPKQSIKIGNQSIMLSDESANIIDGYIQAIIDLTGDISSGVR